MGSGSEATPVVVEVDDEGHLVEVTRAPDREGWVVWARGHATTAPETVHRGLVEALQNALRLEGVATRLHASPAEALRLLALVASTQPAASEAGETLTPQQAQVLAEAGSPGQQLPPLAERASVRTALRAQSILTDALTVQEAAEQLGTGASRVRQRLGDRTLYGTRAGAEWRLPRFQFGPEGAPVPGLDKVLPALPPDLHPVEVVAFLDRPQADLDTGAGPLSARQWLFDGGAVEPVLELAHVLRRAP